MFDLLRKWLKIDTDLISPEERAIEILERQLVLANEEKKQLLDAVLRMSEPVKEEVVHREPVIHQPINRYTPWHVRQQMLEREDAAKAKLMKENDEEQKRINQLEKELELTDATKSESK